MRSSLRTALLVTGPATSPTSLDVALPSSVPFWWKNPPPLLLVMHWFLMIVFRPVGLNAPPQVWPATRPHRARVGSCRKTTKMEITVSCILDASSPALSWVGSGFAFLLSGVLCPWFLRFFKRISLIGNGLFSEEMLLGIVLD